ncbi:MAG: DUF2304 family protein [Candidatus Kerfeldbacteria bacterium]|nr:DUF2304 family protein [Candidatus Kerfeldbacteria bacterium]
MIIKILVTMFVAFVLSRVIFRYRDGSMGVAGFLIWTLLWLGVEVFLWVPQVSDLFAHKIGIGRGVDALVYISIIALFYGAFKLYIKLESVEHDLTKFVRNLAIKDREAKDHKQ